MKKIKYILIPVFVLLAAISFGQSAKKLVRRGNTAYEKNNFSEAEVKYKKAIDKNPEYYKPKFNLGDAFYQDKNYKDADSLFTEVAATAKDKNVKAKAWYNKGNSLLSQKQYEKSIEAYKNALRLNPGDSAAKYNLEYARKKLKKQQQQQKQQQKNKKNKKNDKNKKDNKQNKDKNKQDKKKQGKKDNKENKQQDKKEQQKDKQNKQQQKQGDQQKQQQQQRQKQQISKQEAKRMLDALKNDEKKTLQKLQLQKAKAAHHKTKDIDW